MKVKYLDLQNLHAPIVDDALSAITEIVSHSDFVSGAPVARFEKSFGELIKSRSIVSVSSGTSALHIALLAAGVGPGDEVITTSLTFAATIAAILYVGATPVLVDVERESYLIDIDLVANAVNGRTKAILIVHLHGYLLDVTALRAKVGESLLIIEDAAQAHCAHREGRFAGTIGDIGCFSFYPGKNLGAWGEGGAISVNRDHFEGTSRALRDWGQYEKGKYQIHGYNYRMDSIQAAVLALKLKSVLGWTERRIEIARVYSELLASLAEVRLPHLNLAGAHVYHVYAITCEDRDGLREHLAKLGVQTGIHYPRPVHELDAYAQILERRYPLTISESLSREFLSLPICPTLSLDQVEYVASSIREFYK